MHMDWRRSLTVASIPTASRRIMRDVSYWPTSILPICERNSVNASSIENRSGDSITCFGKRDADKTSNRLLVRTGRWGGRGGVAGALQGTHNESAT